MSASTDIETLASRLDHLAQGLGFPLSNATCVVERGAGQPTKMAEVRNASAIAQSLIVPAEAIRRDPCWRMLKRGFRPFSYDQALYVSDGSGDLWEEQAMYGYRSGIAAVLHIGGDRHFFIGMDSPHPMPHEGEVAMRLLADLQLLVMFTHDAAMRLLVEIDTPNTEAPSLRELEVLKWAAAGKTAWETGTILSISDSTVNKHIASAMRRMNCSSKSQAIARALSMGLL